MSEEGLLRLADFNWASVSRYVEYVEQAAGLRPISWSRVYDLPLARLGPGKVLRQKVTVLGLLEANTKALEVFVGRHKDSLGNDEKAVLRSVYKTMKEYMEMVRSQCDAIELFAKMENVDLLESEGGVENDLPF